ncbi:zinc finger protein 69 homolog [Anabrus simplex]|uniref:zinc finger protein 69 homolog n=1 Tax=Anabrus simplex TaxID=316456 RepID=UPI0035A39258
MELEVNIKEEPAWLEGTRNASLENIEHVSDMVVLKNEVKSELTEPGSTQENTLEQSEDIKKEIFIEQYTDDQLLAYIKEETRSKQEVSCADHQPPDNGGTYFRCNICGEFFSHKVNLNRHMRTHTRDNKHWCNESIEHLSDMVVLKNEVKSELTEPGSTQENTLEVMYMI